MSHLLHHVPTLGNIEEWRLIFEVVGGIVAAILGVLGGKAHQKGKDRR